MTDNTQTTANTLNTPAKRVVGRPFPKGVSGNPGGSPDQARKALNRDTISALHAAFRRGGYDAIDRVMKQNPAMFLKLLVLLVPRELQIEHKGGVKAMSDEQLETALAALQDMLAKKQAGADAKVIEASPNPPDSEIPPTPQDAPKRQTQRKAKRNVGESMGNDQATDETPT